MSAMKRFKELLDSGEPLVTEVWTNGHYQIVENNVSGKFTICSDQGLSETEAESLGGLFESMERAKDVLLTYIENNS